MINMKRIRKLLLLSLVFLLLTTSVPVYAAKPGDNYWNERLQELKDQEELSSAIRDFGINSIGRFIIGISQIDDFVFINGNYGDTDTYHMTIMFLVYPDEYNSDEYDNFLDYNLAFTSYAITSINEIMDDINLVIYSMGTNYYKYNYLWKDLNKEIDALNKKIKTYNNKYNTEYELLPYIYGLHTSYLDYHNDKELQERWESKEEIFQRYYDYPIYPQDMGKGDD